MDTNLKDLNSLFHWLPGFWTPVLQPLMKEKQPLIKYRQNLYRLFLIWVVYQFMLPI